MTYLTLDDNFPDHPKVAGLSPGAFRLHVAGLCYASRHLTDGLVPAEEVPRLVRRYDPGDLAELAEHGLWCNVLDGAWAIHDYLDWNDSRETVLKRRQAAALRQRQWRARQNGS